MGAIIGAAAIGAGAQIGAAALSKGADGGPPPRTEAPGSDTSPGLKVAEFQNLLAQGIFDPTPLRQASPLNQAIGEMLSTANFTQAQKGVFLRDSRLAIDWYRAGQPQELRGVKRGEFRGQPVGTLRKFLDRLAALSSYNTLDDMMAAEASFQEQIIPLLNAAEGAAAGNFKSKLDTQSQIVNLLGNLPDASAQGIEKLRGEEKSRLLRDLNLNVDEQRGDLLELANSGNFNPGRPLGDLEQFRANATQDADLEALGRALALIGGQQTAAGNNLNLLFGGDNQTFNQAQAIAAADQGLRAPGLVSGGSAVQPNNALANALSAGGNTLASGVLAFANRGGSGDSGGPLPPSPGHLADIHG